MTVSDERPHPPAPLARPIPDRRPVAVGGAPVGGPVDEAPTGSAALVALATLLPAAAFAALAALTLAHEGGAYPVPASSERALVALTLLGGAFGHVMPRRVRGGVMLAHAAGAPLLILLGFVARSAVGRHVGGPSEASLVCVPWLLGIAASAHLATFPRYRRAGLTGIFVYGGGVVMVLAAMMALVYAFRDWRGG